MGSRWAAVFSKAQRGHVVPTLDRGPVHLNPAVSIALLSKLCGDVTAFCTTDKRLSCCSRWAASWRLFAMLACSAQILVRRRGCADMRSVEHLHGPCRPLLYFRGVFWVIGWGGQLKCSWDFPKQRNTLHTKYARWHTSWSLLGHPSYPSTDVALLLLIAVEFKNAVLSTLSCCERQGALFLFALLRVWQTRLDDDDI